MSNRERGSYLGCIVLGIALGAITAISDLTKESLPVTPLVGLLILGAILAIVHVVMQVSLEKIGTFFVGFAVGLTLTLQYAL